MKRVLPRQQERAYRTAQALAAAAYDLLQRRSLAEVPVAEIVERAGVSIGAFYARFGCKEALLDWLCQDRLRRDGEEILRSLEALASSGAGLRELVETYVREAAEFYERHAALLREVVRLGYGTTDPEALHETLQVNDEVDRAFVAILLRRRAEILHPDPPRVASFVPIFVAAMLRTFVLLAPATRSAAPLRSRAQQQSEIVQWIMSSLQPKPPANP